MLIDTKVQQSLSKTRNKRLTTLVSDNSLDGLVIDWHLAEYDYSAGVGTAPVQDTGLAHQPTYAYA